MSLAPFAFVHSTRRVIFGWGAIERLPELIAERGASRVALVADPFVVGHALADRLRALAGADLAIHAVPGHEPDTDGVEDCGRFLAGIDPDLILAVGGGTAMDVAKVARMLLSNPGPAEAIA